MQTLLMIFPWILLLACIGVLLFIYKKYPVHLIVKSKTHLQSTFDSIDDPLAIIDSNYTILRTNRAYTGLVGKTFWDVLGHTCYKILRNREEPCLDCKMKQVTAYGRKQISERSPHPRQPNDGIISLTFYPFSDIGSSGDAIVEHIRNITELERLKGNLEEQNAALARTTDRLQEAHDRTNEELSLARQIQLGIMPRTIPKINGLKIAATYHPVESVGGDLYDFIQFSDTKIGVFIGDASGHGLASSFIGTISKIVLYNHTKAEMPASELLDRMNKDLMYNINTGHYVTSFWGVIDLADNSITYARAGHPKPVVISEHQNVHILNASGTFIGIIDDPKYEQKKHHFRKGDRLYIFTDGIYEIMGEQSEARKGVLGYKKFQEILVSCNQLPFEKVIPGIEQQLCQYTYEDDYTLIVIEITRNPG
ncbi:MAG: SpoIIE family protein phosphatase [Chitinivibrionales bacterium]|nr:SpoIIE family protein phosphatase [Chitinivibrionales bacterium]